MLINHIYNLTFRETENIIKENISVRLFLDLTEFWTDIPSYVAIQWWNQEFDENFIKEVVEDFVNNYWNVSIYNGAKAKLAIHFPKIEDIAKFSRITGYLQNISNWNKAKQKELEDRRLPKIR